jgi:hypothetical protein
MHYRLPSSLDRDGRYSARPDIYLQTWYDLAVTQVTSARYSAVPTPPSDSPPFVMTS